MIERVWFSCLLMMVASLFLIGAHTDQKQPTKPPANTAECGQLIV